MREWGSIEGKYSEMNNLDQLILLVRDAAPNTSKEYPVLEKFNETESLNFLVGHRARHFGMSAGKIQKIAHEVEHQSGVSVDTQAFKHQLASTLFTLCSSCDIIGMSGQELIEATAALAEEYKKEFHQ